MNNSQFTSVLFRNMLGFLYLSAGLSKLGNHTFGNIIGPVFIDKMAAQMGVPLWQLHFVTFFQILAGSFLMSRKYYLLGAILVLPLSIGLVIFTLNWGNTLYLNIFFLGLALMLLTIEWKNLKRFLSKNFRQEFSLLGKFSWSEMLVLSALISFFIGILLPTQDWLFMCFAVIILVCNFIELSQLPTPYFLDKFILILFAFNITIIALALYLTQFLDVKGYHIFMVFGIVLVVAAILYLFRLFRYRRA